ncbi:protein STICHEL-like 2 [Canna indica]|uniref:Protein STICHEL-like 2 n=1 Tax=Canna indica TaxID=4628 RepID=A0AAQ3K9D6_9LILI|nr:protein STICHEL-like 2 [Canna indica]
MMEVRRHSVDIPLSRTLVALKRVRSLRDPDTSSLRKIAALVDNMNLETSSCNGVMFGLSSGNKHNLRLKGTCPWHGRKVDSGAESESDRNPLPSDTSTKRSANGTRVRGSCGGNAYRSLDSDLVPCSNFLEKELDLRRDEKLEQVELLSAASLKQCRLDKWTRPCRSKEDDAVCNAGIPSICAAEACTSALCHRSLHPATEKFDFVFPNNSRCGVSCCWSGVPKYDDLKLPCHVEGRESYLNSQLSKESVYDGSSPFQGSLMSLTEKYRPKSFQELVGQNEVAQSLLEAILKGNIAPIYLFHGPTGTGKTSAARILAAALNCHSCIERRPCGFCQDCILVFSGRCRDVTELDASEENHREWSKVLSESAPVPISSCYKVFIIDECQLLERSMWAAICKSIEELSRHAVFIMITSDLDKLPSGTMSWCQRYQFVKVKNEGIVGRLKRICIEEELEFEENALVLLANESSGSLRDAITTLDQLALLGKRITTSLVYELMGVVSDDDLLDLLHSALSADTSGTVRRARDLMSSGIDPMQLTSQLAKLITDILSGGFQLGSSRLIAEAGTEKLRHALNILVETEKQLRTSKDRSTWLTAALIQFNTGESLPPANMNGYKAPQRVSCTRDDEPMTITSPKETLKSSMLCSCQNSNAQAYCDGARELENIWKRTIENCEPSSLKSFLRKKGKLSSVRVYEGLALAEVQFRHPDHATRAEESWNSIVGSLQTVLGCNVDIRISRVPSFICRNSRKKSLVSLFCCSGRKQKTSESNAENRNYSLSHGREKKLVDLCPSHQKGLPCMMQQLHFETMQSSNSNWKEESTTNRSDVHSLINASATSNRRVQNLLSRGCNEEADPSKEVCEGGPYVNIQETKDQPGCFPCALKLSKKSFSANTAHAINPRIQRHEKATEENKGTNDPHIFCSNLNEQATYATVGENR